MFGMLQSLIAASYTRERAKVSCALSKASDTARGTGRGAAVAPKARYGSLFWQGMNNRPLQRERVPQMPFFDNLLGFLPRTGW